MRVFLSYARDDDEPFVKRLADALQKARIEAWFDRQSMPSRSLAFLEEIRRAIDGVDRLVAVMGPAARSSDYVRCEWQYALVRAKPVVPILRLGDYDLPPELRNLHCPDARDSRPWHDALSEIVRVLGEPVPPLGRTAGLPSLPPHFRPRPTALSQLAATVMLDQRQPENPERWRRVTLLSGMGGSGKSVLASALARSTETRRAFDDGVYWVDMRRMPGPEAGLETLVQLTAGGSAGGAIPRAGTAEQTLTAQLQGRRCLLVMDNVERIDQLEPIARCLDTTGRILVTTRERDLVGEANRVALSGLEALEARDQLADWLSLSPRDFDDDCETILRICDGLPFAIAICGSLIDGGVARFAVAARLRSMDLGALQRRFPEYEYPSLLPCLEVSVDALAGTAAQAVPCFERMVVFPAGALIPEATVALLWQHGLRLDAAGCSFHLAGLKRQSLLRSEPEGEVSIHPLVHAYLRLRVSDQRSLHEELLAAYARASSKDWLRGPDDGYYHAHLVHHLLAARGIDAVCSLLVGSPEWMREKIKVQGSALSYLLDVDLALGALDDGDTSIVTLARLAAARHLARKGPRSFGQGVLHAMVRLGMEGTALELARANVDAASRIGQTLEIYEALAESGDRRPDLLDEVERFSMRSADSVSVTAVTSQLIGLYGRAGRFDEALRLWRALPDKNGPSTKWTGQLLARTLAQGGRADEARSVAADSPESVPLPLHTPEADLDAAERSALSIEDPNTRDITLDQLARVFVQAGQLERARSAARAMKHDEMRGMALATIPWRPCLDEALVIARKLNGASRVINLTQAAGALDRLEKDHPPRAPRSRLARWFGPDRTPTHGETVSGLIAEAEREALALEPFEQALCLRGLAGSKPCRERGESRRLLRLARDAASRMAEPLRKASELANIAGELATIDRAPETISEGRALLEHAMALADSAIDERASAQARATVAQVLARGGRFEQAFRLAEGISDDEARERALAVIAEASAEAGDPDRVRRVLERSRDRETSSLAVALARAGRPDEALKAASDPDRSDTLTRIARVFVQQRRYSEALDLLDSLPDEEDSALLRVTAWAEIAGSAADPETTGRALRRALTVAESIFSTTYRSIGFAELAWAEAHLGDREARQRFRRAADLASEKDPRKIFTLTGPSPRFSALKRIGERMTQAGFGDEALAIAESLAGETDSEWYLLRASLIAAVAAHGRRTETLDDQRCDTLFDQALACARKATNSIIGPVAWQAAALLSVAERLALARRWRRAFETLGEAHFTADPFVIGVGTWFEALEERASGLTLAVIAAIAEVFGWQRPDWREVALALTTPG